MRRRLRVAVIAGALTAAACGGSGGGDRDNGNGVTPDSYQATVTRTTFGVPHIEAADFGSLGFGYGYAHAEDNLCVLMEDYVTIAGERARWFGRDGNYVIVPNGAVASNVDSDFFWRFIATPAAVAPIRDNADARGRTGTRGFAAGFSRYVREIKQGQHPGRHLACRDAPWLREVTEDDMYRRYFRLAVIASSSVFVADIANTRPPSGGNGGDDDGGEASSAAALLEQLTPEDLPFSRPLLSASNMYALGKDAVAPGQQSLLFGNPHFPWEGTERLYKARMTIPGELDIAGVGLYGVPLALIGYNEHFAWSHTVSTAFRFTLYELTLVPGDPTSYVYDTGTRQMEAVPLAIEVLEEDGTLTTESRTLYRSHYGPMIGSLFGLPVLPWSTSAAYTLRDVNAENDRLIDQFVHWNNASSLDEFIGLHASVLGIPWVNTVATGPDGDAYYGDVSVVPNVPDSKVQACTTGVSPIFAQLAPGLPVLDGSRSSCEWDTDDDAPAPGIFGPANLPNLRRDDWVHNCNDSHWLTNPAQPLTGFARIIGAENTARSLRTRLCIRHVQRRLAAEDDRPGDRFTVPLLQDVVLDSSIFSAWLAREDVLSTICPLGFVLTQAGPVNVSEACAVLADWDMQSNLDSVGAHIWREFWNDVSRSSAPIWLTPFSSSDPVNTPRGLNVLNPQVQEAMGNAVRRIAAAGFELDAPMGTIQRSGIHDDFIPVIGGEGFEGAFTIANARNQSMQRINENGYRITYGNSYIQTVTWAPKAEGGFRPVAEGFVTYSQSTDPASPYYQDFTEAYASKAWHRFPWTREEVDAQTLERFTLVEPR